MQSHAGLLVVDGQGQRLKETAILETLYPTTSYHYAWSDGQLMALSNEPDQSRLFRWDDAAKTPWKVVAAFPQASVLGFHLVNPNELIFLLKDLGADNLQWWSIDPTDGSSPQLVSSISLASQLGNVFNSTASVYYDGGFTLADDRGLYRITPTAITLLASQTGMQPRRVYHFPGAEHEILVMGETLYLHAGPASLTCTVVPVNMNSWYSWNTTKPTVEPILKDSYGFNHALAAGPVAMSSTTLGSFLEIFENKKLLVNPPPFRDGALLDGPQLPDGQLLVNHGQELWFFKPDF
ncbi:MAG TPA: hypothetical protein VE954_00330 [Oligoflexus sp.]|uniref:hypothetical protein n=1 Tax=Oligoflexus sp. TaxID=1971216 RepID=UPI002D39A0FC|nr:hypothetical protein [Oligoflexus sp.]HYX31524.1 hypothetical protein [Oligoflexus sp.]